MGQELNAALHAVADDLDRDIDRHVVHPRHAFGGRNQALAQRRNLALGGVTEFDVERHIAACDLQVFQRLAADKILAGIGVQHGLQGIQDCLLL